MKRRLPHFSDDAPDRWFTGVEGIVAINDDPERRGRVQCIIPIIDEHEAYPVWARRICLFTGAPGYGDFHPPEKGAEVVLWGRLGDTHNLFYAPLYNENYPVPSDFQNSATRGFRTDGDYKMIVEGDLFIHAGRLIIETIGTARITAAGGVFINGRRY